MESPVTVERMDIRAIRNTSSPSFYDGLENLKGIDINSNSLTFKSVNTRGFATFANTRFMQLVDGMDNSSPALNFALGNLLGMSELDVNTVELLPGASSALYGANAFNGIMFMTSKSPFDDQGVSYIIKTGTTSQKATGDNNFYDTSIRMAHAFSDYFAAKATFSYLKGKDWLAADYRDETSGVNDRGTNPGYNGLNVYGDEVATVLDWSALTGGAIPGSTKVSRTGYNEPDIMEDEARSVKLSVAMHYRPFGNDNLEVIWNSKYGTGNTIYQGQNRYSIKNFFMEQHKLEVRGKNFFVRGYMTSENAGDSYDTRFAAININRQWKSDTQWFQEYAGAYLGAFAPLGVAPFSHPAARAFADRDRLLPGSAGFNAAKAKVTADPSLTTGSKFVDNTKLYHADVNYNFRDLIDVAEIQVGGSFRRYSLNSEGTIFTDYDGPIDYDEYGVYVQAQKKFMDDRLKVTASGRYDKAQNFSGNTSPRFSFSYGMGADRNHNLRASVQTGFRNPTTQDQYIGLNTGAGTLVGSAPDNLDRYTTPALAVSATGQFIANTFGSGIGATTTLSGRRAYDNSISLSSIENGTFQKANIDFVKPERVTAFEAGYRGVISGVTIDLSGYYNNYEDFIATKSVAVPFYGKADLSDVLPVALSASLPAGTPLALVALGLGDFQGFGVYTNSTADISSYGFGIGLSTKVLDGYSLSGSYSWAKFNFDQASDPDFEAGFNTPEHKVKVQFGNPNMFKNFGFNVNLRWQSEYLWEATFYDGMIEARTTVDAQINYRLPQFKSTLKLGGANLGGKEYFGAPGSGAIGSQYYLSWVINP